MTLKVIDQFPFEFYGDHFTVALASDRRLYVPVQALCDAMGLQTHGQIRRIREHDAMAKALVNLNIVWSYGDEAAREREMLCLRLDRLPFWMGTIQTNRIPDETKQERIVQFQLDFADVAWAAFRREILPDDMLAEMDSSLPPAQQEYLRLMDDAAELRQHLQTHDRSLGQHDAQLGSLAERVAALEARLKGTDFLNPHQMKEYTDMVGIVARVLKRKQKGNEATVHAEVKTQFQVPSYQLIPEAEFDNVKRYLRDWFVRLSGPGAPVPAIFEQPSQKRLL
jgi:hypothetical protein